MERNLDRRVEVLCPIADPELRQHLHDVVLATVRADTARAWALQTDGTYVRGATASSPDAVDSQKALLTHYTAADRP
jgi:polyphosphate kinase